jgi:hypothetical protein
LILNRATQEGGPSRLLVLLRSSQQRRAQPSAQQRGRHIRKTPENSVRSRTRPPLSFRLSRTPHYTRTRLSRDILVKVSLERERM